MKDIASGEVEAPRIKQERSGGLGAFGAERERDERRTRSDRRSQPGQETPSQSLKVRGELAKVHLLTSQV